MIQFLNPSWLWALTGLLIPIGIHLLSRKEGKTIPIGSLRHFDESVTAQARSIRLHELFLLLIRCAILTTIVLLLAGIHLSNYGDGQKRWVVIEAGILETPHGKTLVDSLRTQGYGIHYLARNFPEATDTTALTPATNYWAVLNALRTRDLNDVVVVSFAYARNFKGERAALPANVTWISIPPQPSVYTASAVTMPGDSVWIREAQSSAEQTIFKTERVATRQYTSPLPHAAPQDSIVVNVVSGEGFVHDRNLVVACLDALQTTTPHRLIVKTQDVATYHAAADDWTIWLADNEPTSATARSLIYSPCNDNNLPLILPADEAAIACGRVQPAGWAITRRLNQGTVLQENLVLTLATILLPQLSATDTAAHDQRVLPEPLIGATAPQHGSPTVKAMAPETAGYEYWTILIVILIVAERWLAAKRNQ